MLRQPEKICSFIRKMNKYEFIPYSTIAEYIPEMEKNQVSLIARGKTQKTGFLEIYKKYGKNLPEFWMNKRNSFISRTLVAYTKNKTFRRRLSLIAWAYMPK